MDEIPKELEWILNNPPDDMNQFLQQLFNQVIDPIQNPTAIVFTPASFSLSGEIQNDTGREEQLGNQSATSENQTMRRKSLKRKAPKKDLHPSSKSPMSSPIPAASELEDSTNGNEPTVAQLLGAKPRGISKNYEKVVKEVLEKKNDLSYKEAIAKWEDWKLRKEGPEQQFSIAGVTKFLFKLHRTQIVPQLVEKAPSIQNLQAKIQIFTNGKTWMELTVAQREYWIKKCEMLQDWQKEQEEIGLIAAVFETFM